MFRFILTKLLLKMLIKTQRHAKALLQRQCLVCLLSATLEEGRCNMADTVIKTCTLCGCKRL